ncbi:hypothetical protein IMSAGC009_01177 [Lachnospiraceae bacterium]|nr:hypothetical protein IMSAGC009_01177 [Lachnospiraceae bacterium]
MLFKLIERAQKNDKLAMLEMIERFKPLLKKYAAKLKYEDAYDDILLYFIERIKNFNLEKQICRNDEAVASYMKVCIKNFCNKKGKESAKSKNEIVLSALTQEQAYYAEVELSKEDKEDIFMELGIKNLLNEEEARMLYMVYIEGYTITEIARSCNKTRQAVNQFKNRVLRKVKKALDVELF